MARTRGFPTKKSSSKSSDQGDVWTSQAIEASDFNAYRDAIIHQWLRVLTVMAMILVPLFFLLDLFMVPTSLLPRYAFFRAVSTLLAIGQAIMVRLTKPGKWAFLQGYLMSLQVGGIIALMTVDLGGFGSGYYAGLNLVIIGVNLLMPWKALHTGINSLMILAFYLCFNIIAGSPIQPASLINNLFFLMATGILAVAINHVRYQLITKEFALLVDLKKARDSLWSEMELAKKIQTSLLPQRPSLPGYEIAVTMIPALEVGGDYYDVIQTEGKDRWVAIGDVAGHGVDSGLIMMMAQTSLMTAIGGAAKVGPIQALQTLNRVLKENIKRLGENHYMTMMVLRLEDDSLSVAGHHQDLLVYRARTGRVESYPTKGTWLGISDDITPYLEVVDIGIESGDAILLFTDGVTECSDLGGDMFGEARLIESFERSAALPVQEILNRLLLDLYSFQEVQADDITMMVLKRTTQMTDQEDQAETEMAYHGKTLSAT